jgi:endoglucanase
MKPDRLICRAQTTRLPFPRRDFLKTTIGAAATHLVTPLLGADSSSGPTPRPLPVPTAQRLPRWRGFNLLEKFVDQRPSPFRESDFAWIAEFGFNFVRLPMSYRCWTDAQDWLKLKEPVLKEVDQAVELGRKTGVHVKYEDFRGRKLDRAMIDLLQKY